MLLQVHYTYILINLHYILFHMYINYYNCDWYVIYYIDMYNCEALKNMARNLIFSNFAVCSKTAGFNDLSQLLVEYVL